MYNEGDEGVLKINPQRLSPKVMMVEQFKNGNS